MKTNRIVIVSIIILTILTLGAVSASDTAVNETQDSLELSVDEADIAAEDDTGDELTYYNEFGDWVETGNETFEAEIKLPENMTACKSNWIEITTPDDLSEWAEIYIDGYYETSITNHENTNTIRYVPTSTGSHSFEYIYPGDAKYAPYTKTVPFEVENMGISLVEDMIYTYGEDQTIDFWVPEYFYGDFTVTLNGKKYLVESGHYHIDCSSDSLVYGENIAQIDFEGNDEYPAYHGTSTIETIGELRLDGDFEFGSDTKFYLILPSDATGKLVFSQGTYDFENDMFTATSTVEIPLVDGYGEVSFSNYTMGTHYYSLRYSGNYKINDDMQEDYSRFTIKPAIRMPSTIEEHSDANITVRVSDGIEGNVEISYCDLEEYLEWDPEPVDYKKSPIADNTATISLSDLNCGEYMLFIKVDGSSYSKSLYVVESTDFEMEVRHDINEIIMDNSEEIYVSFPKFVKGNVDLYVDGNKIDSDLVFQGNEDDSALELKTKGLGAGMHTFEVAFTSDEFKNTSYTDNFTVVSAQISIPEKIRFNYVRFEWSGDYIEVQVPLKATGNITTLVDGEIFSVDKVYNGQDYYSISLYNNVTLKDHEVEVIYSGDSNYPGTSLKKRISMLYDVDVYTYMDSVIVAFPSIQEEFGNGDLTIKIDGIEYDWTIDGTNQVAVNISGLKHTTHNITVSYGGDEKFYAQNFTKSIEYYSEIDTTFDTGINNLMTPTGKEEVFLVLGEDAKGKLNIHLMKYDSEEDTYIDYDIKDVEFVNGKATYTLINLPFGKYELIGTYTGDDYLVDYFDLDFKVTSTIADSKDILIGDDKTVSIDAGNIEGKVTIEVAEHVKQHDYEEDYYYTTYSTVDSYETELENGKASHTFSNLKIAKYRLRTIIESGDEIIEDTYFDFEVLPLNITDLTIHRIVYNEPQEFTIELPDYSEGVLVASVYEDDFEEDDIDRYHVFARASVEGNGSLSLKLPSLPLGEHYVRLVYSGSCGHYTQSYTILITPKMTYPEWENSNNNEFIIEMPNSYGKMFISLDDEDYNEMTPVEGKITVKLPYEKPGQVTVRVRYEENGTTLFSDVYYPYAQYHKDVNVNVNTPEEGDDLTVTVEVYKFAESNVTLTIANQTFTQTPVYGKATFTISDLAAGTYPATVEYSGNYIISPEIKEFEAEVKSPKTIPEMSIDAKNITEGDLLTLNVLIPGASGYVIAFIGDKNVTAEFDGGKATVNVAGLTKGEYEISVFYIGDDKYFNTSGYIKVNVAEKIDPKIESSDLKMRYCDGSYFSVKVYDNTSKLAENVKVVFKIKGNVVKTVTTKSNGVARFKITQLPGKYTVVTQALGVSVKNTLTVYRILTLKTVKVKKSSKKITLTATLKKVNGKYLKGKKITFKFNGKKYTAKTNKKGVAKVTVKPTVYKKLKVGKKVTYSATYIKDTVKKTVKVSK